MLYTCPFGTRFGSPPGALAHPCGRAAEALDRGEHAYEVRQVRGGIGMPWTWPSRRRDRAEVERLSGKRSVPILVLDDGTVVSGSGAIERWARATPASAS